VIQCNGARPNCSQCKKIGRPCPGYRDAFEAIFRNETESTKRKASRGKSAKISKVNTEVDEKVWFAEYYSGKPAPVGFYNAPDGKTPSSPKPPFILDVQGSPGRILQTSVGERGLCFFMSNFVLMPEESGKRGYLDFLPLLMKDESYPNSTLSMSISAVSIAAFANRPANRSLLPLAAGRYSEALQKINKDLKHRKLVLEDQTLASVMLLGLYEV
jgi:hypothetical protein